MANLIFCLVFSHLMQHLGKKTWTTSDDESTARGECNTVIENDIYNSQKYFSPLTLKNYIQNKSVENDESLKISGVDG